jgi:hypothetical protein
VDDELFREKRASAVLARRQRDGVERFRRDAVDLLQRQATIAAVVDAAAAATTATSTTAATTAAGNAGIGTAATMFPATTTATSAFLLLMQLDGVRWHRFTFTNGLERFPLLPQLHALFDMNAERVHHVKATADVAYAGLGSRSHLFRRIGVQSAIHRRRRSDGPAASGKRTPATQKVSGMVRLDGRRGEISQGTLATPDFVRGRRRCGEQ